MFLSFSSLFLILLLQYLISILQYDPQFGDAFWNSSKFGMVNYLLRMMSSWAIVCSVWYLPPMNIEVKLFVTTLQRNIWSITEVSERTFRTSVVFPIYWRTFSTLLFLACSFLLSLCRKGRMRCSLPTE